jgi:GNAT superfamily N-acetyltransferase
VACVHVRSWQAAYRGLLPDEYLDGLRAEDRANRYTFDLVRRSDGVGTGVGRVLMADARTRLSDLGFTEAVLWVLTGNDRADRFYRADGWLPDGRDAKKTSGAFE